MSALTNKKGKVTPENLQEAARLKALWDAAKAAGRVGSQEAFGAMYGIGNQAAVGFFLNGKTALSMKAATGFARGLNCRVVDFSPRLASELQGLADVAAPPQDGGPNGKTQQNAEFARLETLVAQSMSHPLYQDVPTTMKWGDLRMGKLPAAFGVHLPDDSMAPEAKAGALVWFERDLEPRPGDWVLVLDNAGHPYLREYRQRRPGQWYAHALNPAFEALDPERDGLKVAAVFVGMRARRG